MEVSPLVAVAVAGVGFLSGVLSGMVGIGGAVLTTPGIRLLGATPIEAVGSTIPAILPAAVTGSVRYSRERLVEWRVALVSGVVGTGFSVVGAWVSDVVNAHVLMVLTAVLLGMSAVKTLRERRPAPPPAVPARTGAADRNAGDDVHGDDVHGDDVHGDDGEGDGHGIDQAPGSFDDEGGRRRRGHHTARLAAVGAGAGALAGVLGVGGGLILVPGYMHVLGLPAKRAVATSLVAVALFSIPAMVTHTMLGHMNWSYAVLLMVGVVPGARAGAHITITGSEARLKLITGSLFAVTAVIYGVTELVQLR